MVRERNSAQRLAAQRDPTLPPTLQLERGLCRIVKPDATMRKTLGYARNGERPTCSGAGCSLYDLIASCTKPLELEIGSGLGRFILERTRSNPGVHFIGLEQEQVRVARIDVAARLAGISNLSLVCAEAMAVLEFCFPACSIGAVYLFFPDPWPKARHEKNRIFQKAFIDQIYRVLTVGGCLHVATDDAPYFTNMKALMLDEKRFEETKALARTEEELTDFELKFLAKDKQTKAASWRKI